MRLFFFFSFVCVCVIEMIASYHLELYESPLFHWQSVESHSEEDLTHKLKNNIQFKLNDLMDSNGFNSIVNWFSCWIVKWINGFSEAFKLISDSLSIILHRTLKVNWNMLWNGIVVSIYGTLRVLCLFVKHNTYTHIHNILWILRAWTSEPMNKRHNQKRNWPSLIRPFYS